MKENREYRDLQQYQTKDNYIIEGYCALFQRYVLTENDGISYYEEIDKRAFENTDFKDMIFQLNHSGRVYARVSNGTLEFKIDDKGLFVRADLSKTEAARELYDEIKAGMYLGMSYGFITIEDDYNVKTRTRIIKKIKKVFDCSICDHVANSSTSITARSYFKGVIETVEQELQKRNIVVNEYIKVRGNL